MKGWLARFSSSRFHLSTLSSVRLKNMVQFMLTFHYFYSEILTWNSIACLFFLSCQIPSFREHILSSRLQLLNVLVSLCFKLLLEATYSPWLKGWKPILYHWKVVQNMVILINKLPCDCVLRAAIVGHEKRQALAWYSLYGRLQPLLHILILMPWMCWRDVPQRHTWIVEAEA